MHCSSRALYGVDLDRAIKMLDDSEAMLNEAYSLGKTVLPQIMSTMGNVAGNFVNVFTAIASASTCWQTRSTCCTSCAP